MKNSNLKTFTATKTARVIAIFLLITLLIPIASPIPLWASNLNLPKSVDDGFRLTAPTPLISNSTLGFVSNLVSNLGLITGVAKSEGSNESEKTNTASKAVLLAKVKKIKTQITDEKIIKVGESVLLNAIPLDEKGNAVQGLVFDWESANQDILRITPDGKAIALIEGDTMLTAKLGKFKKDFVVKVSNIKAVNISTSTTVNQLPDAEIESKYSPVNNVGNPPGKTEMESPQQPAALGIRHRVGISNFSFGLPLASLSGRGLNAGIGMSYNSRAWNKSATPIADPPYSQPHFTYDVEESWIAPGFSSGFGYLETQNRLFSTHPTTNTGVFTNYTEIVPVGLVDSDGTRHQFGCASWTQISGTYESECNKYAAQDGTFITILGNKKKYNLNNSTQIDQSYTSTFIVNYPNGSKIYYGDSYGSVSGFTKKQYAYSIQERNGNRISINYLAGGKGKIDFILDTMNRYIRFYYDTTAEQKLVTITVPAYGETTAERQVVRFYYAEIPLDYVGKYTGTTTAPATIKVLNRVYYPATNMGYKYDYHPNFGMITKIQRFHGMVPSGNSTTETGTITNDGNWAATTEYNYPVSSTPIDDVPKYNERTDDWYGRDTSNSPPKVLYHSPTENPPQYGTPRLSSRIETANGTYSSNTINETYSNYEYGWKDGLVHETIVREGNGQFGEIKSKTKYFWEATLVPFGGYVPFLRKIEVTNDAGQTKATRFEYDEYNNQKAVDEHDFAASGSLGTLLKRTETTYQTGAGWLDRNLISLPTSVVTKVDNIPVSKTLIEYDHNGDDSTLVRRNDISISTHDTFYNPAHPVQCQIICGGDSEPCNANSQNLVPPNGCVIHYTYGYKAASAFRGNVTKVTTFSDATLTSDPNAAVSNTEYDITGNAVEASASCCKIKAWNYDKANEYAFVVSEEQGDTGQLVTSSTYDRNTGLMKTATDENNQTTTVTYDPTSLRQTRVDKPNDAWSTVEYHDQSYPFYVKSTSSLDTNRNVSSWSFSDGRGASYRTRSQTLGGYLSSDVGFDKNGSPIKNYSPYTVSGINDPRPSGTKYSEVTNRDALGRVLSTKLTDDTIVSATYNGTVATATDQAGKTRRQVADALGRTVRVDEPDANGNLGTVASPIQPTYYEYDGNDNLKKVTQSDGTLTQERLFKYDSLSRLTHEKQVEATATLDIDGNKVGSGGLWTGFYKYDNESLLTEGVDARGVKTTFSYDGLNRVESVTYTGESGYATPNVSYTYDELRGTLPNKGRLTTVQTAANATQGTPETKQMYDYDVVGQVVNHTQSIGNQSYNLTYGYNLAGQLVSEKYPSGKVFNYSVDDYGRLQSVADSQRQYLSSVSFTNQGLLSSMNLGNGTSESFDYNDRFQMKTQSLKKGSQVLQQYDYGYGKVDLATGAIDTSKNNGQLGKITSFIGATQQSQQRFDYDSIGRLSESREYLGATNTLTYKQHFDFDRFGNMYRKAAQNGTAGQANPLPMTAIEENVDISKSTNRFLTGTTYNDAGMVIADNKFRSMNFSYDANGRQVNATNTGNSTTESTVYDALGNRVATKVNDSWQFVIYDAFGKLVAEYGTQSEGNGGVSYVLQDWQGSVRASVNANGFIQARFDFTAFGEEINLNVGLRSIEQGYSGDATTRKDYALTEKDSTGLNHTWFRKSENRAARWTSPDPARIASIKGNAQSWNKYSYNRNDPINYVDPSGLNAQWCQWYANFHYPNGFDHPETRYQVGNSWLVCIDIPGGGSGSAPGTGGIDFPGGGGTTAQFEGKDKEAAEKFRNCVNTKIQRIQRDFEEEAFGANGIADRARANAGVTFGLGLLAVTFEVGLMAALALPSGGFSIPVMIAVVVATVLIDAIAIAFIYTQALGEISNARTRSRNQMKDAFEDCASDFGITLGQAPKPLPGPVITR